MAFPKQNGTEFVGSIAKSGSAIRLKLDGSVLIITNKQKRGTWWKLGTGRGFKFCFLSDSRILLWFCSRKMQMANSSQAYM